MAPMKSFLNGSVKSFVMAPLGALALLSAPYGCNETRPAIDARDDEGLRMCCELEVLCPEGGSGQAGQGGEAGAGSDAGAASGPGTAAGCHELGHQNDPNQCRLEYEDCLELCGIEPEAGGVAECR